MFNNKGILITSENKPWITSLYWFQQIIVIFYSSSFFQFVTKVLWPANTGGMIICAL